MQALRISGFSNRRIIWYEPVHQTSIILQESPPGNLRLETHRSGYRSSSHKSMIEPMVQKTQSPSHGKCGAVHPREWLTTIGNE